MNCININHPDFKKLLDETGIPAFELEIKVADWQEKNGVGKFPTKSQLSEVELSRDVPRNIKYLQDIGVITKNKYKGSYWIKMDKSDTLGKIVSLNRCYSC